MNKKDFDSLLFSYPLLKKRTQGFQNEMFRRNAAFPFDFIKMPIMVTQS